MKDPMQPYETPYEILGIAQDADKNAVDTALKKAVMAGQAVSKARSAWNVLSKPHDRLFADIFMYHRPFIEQWVPGIEAGLPPDKRESTARRLRELEKQSFPNIPATHSLAVLFYWSAIAAEEAIFSAAAKEAAKPNDEAYLSTLWQGAIARWTTVLASGQFWGEWEKAYYGRESLSPAVIREACSKIEEHFSTLFHNTMERYAKMGDARSAARFYEYEHLFNSDLKAAKKFAGAGAALHTEGKIIRIECGRLLLKEAGLIEAFKNELHSDPKLRELEGLLSDYAAIRALVENKRGTEAIAALERLPFNERQTEEPLTLRVEALQELGRQHLEMNDYDKAFAAWKEALQIGYLCQATKDIAVKDAKQKALQFQVNDHNTAVFILKSALELVPGNSELKSTMSEILLQNAIKRINAAEKEFNAGKQDSKAFSSIVKQGVHDLEQAVSIDPSNTRAKEQLEAAKRIFESIDYYAVYKMLDQKRWSEAEKYMRGYLSAHPDNASAKQILDLCLQNLCWFCKKQRNEPDSACAKPIDVHKVVSRSYNSVQFQKATVSVPRCKKCSRNHKKEGTVTMVAGLITLVFWFFFSIFVFEMEAFGAILLFVVFLWIPAFFSGYLIGMIITKIFFSSDTKSESFGNKHPALLQAQKEGWLLGSKPAGTK